MDVAPGKELSPGSRLAMVVTNTKTEVPAQPIGLLSRIFEYGIMWQVIPPLIFLCLGALTDFGPMIANPRTLILSAAAQFGIFFAFFAALIGMFMLGNRAARLMPLSCWLNQPRWLMRRLRLLAT